MRVITTSPINQQQLHVEKKNVEKKMNLKFGCLLVHRM